MNNEKYTGQEQRTPTTLQLTHTYIIPSYSTTISMQLARHSTRAPRQLVRHGTCDVAHDPISSFRTGAGPNGTDQQRTYGWPCLTSSRPRTHAAHQMCSCTLSRSPYVGHQQGCGRGSRASERTSPAPTAVRLQADRQADRRSSLTAAASCQRLPSPRPAPSALSCCCWRCWPSPPHCRCFRPPLALAR